MLIILKNGKSEFQFNATSMESSIGSHYKFYNTEYKAYHVYWGTFCYLFEEEGRTLSMCLKPDTSIVMKNDEELKSKSVLDEPIKNFGASARLCNGIKYELNIKEPSLNDLITASKSASDLLKYRNFGKKSVLELMALLHVLKVDEKYLSAYSIEHPNNYSITTKKFISYFEEKINK